MKRLILILLIVFTLFGCVNNVKIEVADDNIESKHDDTPENLFKDLDDLKWFNEIKLSDIVEIKIIKEGAGVELGSGIKRAITTSVDRETIKDIYDRYSSLEVTIATDEEEMITGGMITTVKFTLIDGTVRKITFLNDCYYDEDICYLVSGVPSFKDGSKFDTSYGFVTYSGVGEVTHLSSDACVPFIICDIPMDEIEFIALSAEFEIEETNYQYSLSGDFGTLHFVSNEVFRIQNDIKPTYYKLVGNNLDELIEKYLELSNK